MKYEWHSVENQTLRRVCLVLMAIILTPIVAAGGLVVGAISFINGFASTFSGMIDVVSKNWNYNEF